MKNEAVEAVSVTVRYRRGGVKIRPMDLGLSKILAAAIADPGDGVLGQFDLSNNTLRVYEGKGKRLVARRRVLDVDLLVIGTATHSPRRSRSSSKIS